jgi:hypothetical protein
MLTKFNETIFTKKIQKSSFEIRDFMLDPKNQLISHMFECFQSDNLIKPCNYIPFSTIILSKDNGLTQAEFDNKTNSKRSELNNLIAEMNLLNLSNNFKEIKKGKRPAKAYFVTKKDFTQYYVEQD